MLCDARFDPAERLELIEREGVDVLCQAPTEYRMLAKRTELRPLPSLRRMVSAGEALDREVIEAWREAVGLEIHDGYGQTETGPPDREPRRRRGPPRLDGPPAARVRAARRRRRSGDAAAGELQVRVGSCPTFFSRYLDGEPFDGEWWPTGDLVREDDDGYLWFEGRRDDLIVSAGYRIGPVEVESALLTHPAVGGGCGGARRPTPSAARS